MTAHPYAAWAAQQIVEAIGAEIVPERLIRDRDAIFSTAFDARVDNLGVRQIRVTPRPPWQNGHAERWVGTLRRELRDHVIVLGEWHLLRLVRQCVTYYNEDRPHMALRGDAPIARAGRSIASSCSKVQAALESRFDHQARPTSTSIFAVAQSDTYRASCLVDLWHEGRRPDNLWLATR